jgi:hypothetical protein
MSLEDFFSAHQYTIAALGALGTFAAVVVALFNSVAALRASRTKIRARFQQGCSSQLTARKGATEILSRLHSQLGNYACPHPDGVLHWKLPLKRGLHEVTVSRNAREVRATATVTAMQCLREPRPKHGPATQVGASAALQLLRGNLHLLPPLSHERQPLPHSAFAFGVRSTGAAGTLLSPRMLPELLVEHDVPV